MQAGKPCSCCLALPCCHGPASLLSQPLPHLTGGPPSAFLIASACLQGRQGKTGQGAGSTGAHHWPKATGCRISRGWLPAHRGLWIGEAPGGVGSCRDDWESLEELGGPLPSPRPNRIARSGSCLLLALPGYYRPACAATAAPDTGADSWARVVKEGRGVRACVKR